MGGRAPNWYTPPPGMFRTPSLASLKRKSEKILILCFWKRMSMDSFLVLNFFLSDIRGLRYWFKKVNFSMGHPVHIVLY